MNVKRVLCPERLRQIPRQFSWIDHRLVRDRHICRADPVALALYLFVVTVGDAQGLSFYSDRSIAKLLSLSQPELLQARRQLLEAGLAAYEKPLYQVLSLDGFSASVPTPRRPMRAPQAIGDILKQIQEQKR